MCHIVSVPGDFLGLFADVASARSNDPSGERIREWLWVRERERDWERGLLRDVRYIRAYEAGNCSTQDGLKVNYIAYNSST